MKFTFTDTLETIGSITDSLVKGVALILFTSTPVIVGFNFFAEWASEKLYEMDPNTRAHIEHACEGRADRVQVGAFHYDCSIVNSGADPIEW